MKEGTRVTWRGGSAAVDAAVVQPGDSGVVVRDTSVGYGPASVVAWDSGAQALHLDAHLATGFEPTHVVALESGAPQLRALVGDRLVSHDGDGPAWRLDGAQLLVDGAPVSARVWRLVPA